MNITSILPVLICSAGIYLFIKLRAFFLLHPIRTAKAFFSALRDRSSRRSLCLALAGTLGVGNIFGVAVGLIIGGPGSLFWLFVSSLFASVIKYSETSLTVSNVAGKEGIGMMHVILRTFRRLSGPLSCAYAALCLALAMFMGAGLQSDSLAECAYESIGWPPQLTAAVFALVVIFLVSGGTGKIVNATEFLIPLTTLVYIFLCVTAIILNFESLLTAICCVLSSAFSPASAGGGVIALLFSSAMREGFARGILSNEAGAGTSAMAHSRSGDDAVTAGLFGMCEVFFDTVLLCPLTGLAILSSVPDPTSYSSAMSLVADAICGTLGAPSLPILLLCILSFALSTVVCWYYYGGVCRRFLFGDRYRRAYALIFVASIFFGALAEGFLTVAVTDVLLLLMTLITLATLVSSSDKLPRIGCRGNGENKYESKK